MCKLSSTDLKKIEKIVSWECQPFFPRMGRSAWYRLQEPIWVTCADREIPVRSVKIKGVGLRNHRGEVAKPSPSLYRRSIAHLGITSRGEFTEAFGSHSPMGGIALDKAIVEFYASSLLAQHDCCSQVPLQLFQYCEPDLACQIGDSAPMPCAVVVSGHPNEHYQRADIIVNYPFQPEQVKRLLNPLTGSPHIEWSSRSWLEAVSRMWHLYSRNLRKLHEAGLYRSNASPSNYGYCPELENIFFIDLDSVRPLSECSAFTKPLQIMRDVSSPIFHAMLSLLGKNHIALYEIDDLCGILEDILRGYFFDVEGDFDSAIFTIKRHFKQVYCRLSDEYRHSLEQEVSLDLPYEDYMLAIHGRRSELIDRPGTMALCTVALWNLYSKSGMHNLYPHQMGRLSLEYSLAKFLSGRAH
jgi:hypothetical protein